MKLNDVWKTNQRVHSYCGIRLRKNFCSQFHSVNMAGRFMHASNNAIINLGKLNYIKIGFCAHNFTNRKPITFRVPIPVLTVMIKVFSHQKR